MSKSMWRACHSQIPHRELAAASADGVQHDRLFRFCLHLQNHHHRPRVGDVKLRPVGHHILTSRSLSHTLHWHCDPQPSRADMSPTLDLVSTRRERHQKSLTALQHYFGLISNRPHPKDVPSISEPLLTRTRNSRRNSPENNDLLEFVGDRCVNLVVALLVDKVRVSWRHHIVGYAICIFSIT